MIRLNKLLLLLLVLYNGCNDKNVKKTKVYSCKKEYTQYNDIVGKYKIRMEENIQSQGCDIIPIYASIIKSKEFDILDEIDENPNIMKQLVKLYSINREIIPLLLESSILKNILVNNNFNSISIENFIYLMEKNLQKKDFYKMKKNRSYINYFIIASIYAKDKSESQKLYNRLKSSILVELISSFSLLLESIGKDYPFESLIESFSILTKELTVDEIDNLSQYPQYFVYFLFPKKEDLSISLISEDRLNEIQKEVQEKVIYLYQEIFQKYHYDSNVMNNGLMIIQNIYPYLLESYNVQNDEFKRIFHYLIKHKYIVSLLETNICSKKTEENFAIFGNRNIENISQFFQKNRELSLKIFTKIREPHDAFLSFLYIANARKNLNKKEWKIFKNLLETLPKSYEERVIFLKKVEEVGYFREIVQQLDYNQEINSDYGDRNKKYKYILLTPYPSQNDKTLYETVLTTNISDDELKIGLNDLIAKNQEELETHEFTKFEKFFGNINKIDNAITVASIIASPFISGMSLSYVATKVSSKVVTKKGAKYLMKKVAKKVLNKSILRIRKVRKLINNKTSIKSRNIINKSFNNLGNMATALMIGNSLLYSNDIEFKEICKE